MSRCRHRLVAEHLTATRRRPIPAMYRPGWHPGVLKLVCVTCGELMPLHPTVEPTDPEVLRVHAIERRAAVLAQHQRDVMLDVFDRDGIHWTDEESDGWQASAMDWPVVSGCEAGWLAREIWFDTEEDK